jgi:hypothetical protein
LVFKLTKLNKMKDNKFTPIKISENHEQQRQYTNLFNDKIRSFNALYLYLSKFIKIEDKNTLQNDIYSTFITAFLDKESVNFPPNSPVNSILHFFEVNTNKIQSLIDDFNAIDFDLTDVDLNEPTLPTKDFGTYTKTNEQNILFTKIDNVIKAIEQLEKLNKVVYKAPLVNAFAFMLHYDFSTQKLNANASYILGNMRG